MVTLYATLASSTCLLCFIRSNTILEHEWRDVCNRESSQFQPIYQQWFHPILVSKVLQRLLSDEQCQRLLHWYDELLQRQRLHRRLAKNSLTYKTYIIRLWLLCGNVLCLKDLKYFIKLWEWFNPGRTQIRTDWFDWGQGQPTDFFVRPPTLTNSNFEGL